MDTFRIVGGKPVSGTIRVAGNKNAALPMLAAALLSDEPVRLDNVPDIRDVRTMLALLADLGASVERLGPGRFAVSGRGLRSPVPTAGLCQQMRASFVLAGPLLARLGRAELPVPGGDRIGRRPVDAHIHALEELGARVEVRSDSYVFTAPKGLAGADIFLQEMSVMATENAVMAAVLAKGRTVIRNAASEPHVQDLCRMLSAMGAKLEGCGTNTLTIDGVERLHAAEVSVGSDYLEVGSFIALAAVTGGELLIQRANPADHRVTAVAFGRLGVRFEVRGDDLFVPGHQELVVSDGVHGAIPKIADAPWPGFPADLTSVAVVLATQARGTVLIHEWMYESRLFWLDRLIAMGARIVVCDPHRAVITGPAKLYAQTLTSPDIRAGMGLLIASLAAEGVSTIHNAQQIDRGYENIEQRLQAIGAQIERV